MLADQRLRQEGALVEATLGQPGWKERHRHHLFHVADRGLREQCTQARSELAATLVLESSNGLGQGPAERAERHKAIESFEVLWLGPHHGVGARDAERGAACECVVASETARGSPEPVPERWEQARRAAQKGRGVVHTPTSFPPT